MRIFIGLIEISGYYSNLKKGFDELGVKSTYINLLDHPFEYGGANTNVLAKLVKSSRSKLGLTPRWNLFGKLWWIGWVYIARVSLFLWALVKHDTFIFSHNSTFFNFRELPILKFFNKKIIYMFHGSDSRPPYINAAVQENHRYQGTLNYEEILKITREKKAWKQRLEHYADVIADSPLCSHFSERPIVCNHLIGLPFQADHVHSSPSLLSDPNVIRILHCPSVPRLKGTPRVRQAIKNLRAKGYSIDYVEVTDKPHVEVLKELACCDFVVDQLYGDGPISGFATEAAFFGKPAIFGTYTADAWEIYSADQIPLVHRCHSDAVESAIEELIINKEYRIELGKRAQQFVRSRWTPKKVAERFVQLIEGDIPDDWMYNPRNLRYVHGFGPENQIRQTVREVIEMGGKDALQLSDKPELERKFIEFAGLDPTTLSS